MSRHALSLIVVLALVGAPKVVLAGEDEHKGKPTQKDKDGCCDEGPAKHTKQKPHREGADADEEALARRRAHDAELKEEAKKRWHPPQPLFAKKHGKPWLHQELGRKKACPGEEKEKGVPASNAKHKGTDGEGAIGHKKPEAHKPGEKCCGEDGAPQQKKHRKGNNGVGNGEDPQPPGNPPVNDGPGSGAGSPGAKGGKH